ncbi:hypothetical protein D7223_00085 [Micromonospora endolithica]|uniref:Uncharacterized protein n=1 Tax=Micromonospora endolithica TaxID=230091 RepID=A0A3A9ZQ01_9ACTN|nr:hypothetical protein D7223_00085 [Micromonospora endolithica]
MEAPPRARRLRPGDPAAVRRLLTAVGVPTMAFDWTVTELLRGDDAIRARVEVGPADTWAPVLDAVLSVAPAAFGGPDRLRMVAGLARLRLAGVPPETVDIQVTVRDGELDVAVDDARGGTVARLDGLRYGSMDEAAGPAELVHELTWQPLESAPGAEARDLVLVGAEPAMLAALA